MRATSIRTARVVVLGLLTAATRLTGQVVPESDAVPNWAAPPYWMPRADERKSQSAETRHLLAPAVASASLAFHAVTPCRVADTRGNGFSGPYGPPHLTAGAVRGFAVTSPGTSCGVPSGVAAVSFNFAVTNLSANGNLIAYPTGGSAPSVSSLNWTPSEVAISNAAVIALGSDSINVAVNGPVGSTVDLIVDVNGYYAADPVVSSLNGASGALSLVAGGDVTVAPGSGIITIGTDATSANAANTIVRRDASGDFAAGTITATGVTLNGGDLQLGAAGRLLKNASLFLHTGGNAVSTFAGADAGNVSTTGAFNTGLGSSALQAIAGGAQNVAVGSSAGQGLTAGNYNVAVGVAALAAAAADYNVALGFIACSFCAGSRNVALGPRALDFVTTGDDNIAVGPSAGANLGAGSSNIYFGNPGAASESGAIRIGVSGIQTSATIAGIIGSTVPSGVPVLINGQGQLGTTTSSARFKEDVRDLGADSDGLLRLRPVTFRYKPDLDPEGIDQYGLIAEEVEAVYPGLVSCGEDGQPQGVRYHFLVPMLLNEVQKDRREIADLKARLARIESVIAVPRDR